MAEPASKDVWASEAAPLSGDWGGGESAFRLAVDELQPGARGEVVLFNDSAFRGIVIEAAGGKYETGAVRDHVTAEGVDVSGFRFVRFDDGVVVYHTPDTEITVVAA